MGQFQRRPGHSLQPAAAGGSTIRSHGGLNNYMYYGDYEDGEFFAEDLDFKDEKQRKISPGSNTAPPRNNV